MFSSILFFVILFSFCGLPQQPINETTNELPRRGHEKDKFFKKVSTPAP